jgi:translation initiation factor 3 subunit D
LYRFRDFRYNTDYLAKSLNVSMENAWGVVRALLDVVRGRGDGRWVILKDPSKASLRIYETPVE